MIRKIVQQAFQTEFLSFEEEYKIRQSYQNSQLDDIDALINLQQALNAGYVQQESKAFTKFTVPNYQNHHLCVKN